MLAKHSNKGAFLVEDLKLTQVIKYGIYNHMPNTNKNGTAGQPTKMTPEVLQAIRNAADFGCNDREILAHLTIIGMPIARDTLYKYFERNPEFRTEIDDRQESPILRAKQTLSNALSIPENADLSLKYLERKRSMEFSTKNETDVKFSFDTLKEDKQKYGI